jgi:Fe2+ transport system protein FeoA
MPTKHAVHPSVAPLLTLSDLKPGERGLIQRCLGSGAVFQRLCEMGFVEGTRLRVVRYAPFGDPLEVDMDGCHVSLRRAEAAMVLVDRA